MSKGKEIFVKILKTVFGIGILICLLVGGLSFFGYLAALIIGGETAGAICTFIYKTMYPVLVLISTSMILVGVLKLYVCGETKQVKKNRPQKEAAGGAEQN
ncbi:MAG: hypothetical protein K6G45_03185 [Lachnospiraceae bacterium]|nr:hypothetical protein [Lachnospiraceae bacterium]MCR5767478.1 hypothetical protein [Lachnospiraceae bacterium]